MTESRWENLGRPHNITVDHREHASLIRKSTCVIGNAVRQLLQQLNDRALSLTACVQYDLALQDAAIMRELAPRCSLGYLRACDVYSSQGRQRMVIDMCNQGLAAMAHDDPDYRQLQVIMGEAKHINTRRVDFISKLPFDIVACNLMPRIMDSIMPFDSNRRSPLFYVSRAWHQRILQATDGLTFYARTSNAETFTEGHHHLLRFAPFVTRLEVDGKVNTFGQVWAHQKGPSLCHLFTRNTFTKLTTLNIQVDTGSVIIVPTRLKSALKKLGSQLKHLSITRNKDDSTSHGFSIILSDIIRCCGNLVSLTIEGIPVETASLSSSNMERTEMRHLKIFQASPRITSQKQLITMLMIFPFLTFLAINPALEPTILAQIYHHCPLLEQLVYWDDDRDTSSSSSNTPCKRISVANHQLHLTMESIALCMIQRADSLDTFEYQGMFLDNLDDRLALRMLGFDTFLQLRTVSFSHVDASCIPFFLWVVQHAPHIQSITLHDPAIDASVIDAIMQLQHIHTLNLYTHDARALLPFMKHHALLASRSTLRHMQVSTTNTMCNALWFREIANLQNLESFELSIPKRILDTFAPFFEQMTRGCLNLKWLKLVADETADGSSMPTIETSVIEALTSFHNLRRLTLHASIISDISLGFLANMKNLQRLELQLNRFIDPITMRRLKTAIDYVVIESRRPQ